MDPRSGHLREFLRLLDEAALVLPAADEVVAACGEQSEVAVDLVRAGSRLQVVFSKLRDRLGDLDLDQDLEPARDRAGRLLLYHQWMLREALLAACPVTAATGTPDRAGSTGWGHRPTGCVSCGTRSSA